MPLSSYKSKRLRFVFVVYWFLLLYIVAALVWWFIELNGQNRQMAEHSAGLLNPASADYNSSMASIKDLQKRKTAQYIGEGSVFFLVIMAGAFFIFRSVRRQLKLGQQQQNFMMAITHELKTPIAVAKLNLETLQKRKLEEAQQQRLINTTIQEANRLNALCNNMLLVAQIEDSRYSFTKERIDLSELVTECVHDFQGRFPERHYVVNIQERCRVKGDKLLLQLAVNNLVDNATKYSGKEMPVEVALHCQQQQVQLQVKDCGKGIAAAEKKKVFEKFYRVGNKATREAKGTGLGLYLTRKIALQHKGKIFIKDHLPAGSIFILELPAEA